MLEQWALVYSYTHSHSGPATPLGGQLGLQVSVLVQSDSRPFERIMYGARSTSTVASDATLSYMIYSYTNGDSMQDSERSST